MLSKYPKNYVEMQFLKAIKDHPTWTLTDFKKKMDKELPKNLKSLLIEAFKKHFSVLEETRKTKKPPYIAKPITESLIEYLDDLENPDKDDPITYIVFKLFMDYLNTPIDCEDLDVTREILNNKLNSIFEEYALEE